MIIIDTREAKLIDLFKLAKIPCEIVNLPIGDIILRHTLDITTNTAPNTTQNNIQTFEFILERKCVQDMVASIKDGRYKEQKLRLLAEAYNPANTHTTSNTHRHVIIAYIVEGTPAELRVPADKTMLLGSVISSTFRDNISILRTYSLQETFDLLVRMHDRLARDYADFFPTKQNQPTPGQTTNTNNLDGSRPDMPSQDVPSQDMPSGGGASANASSNYLAAIKKNKKDNMTPAMWNMACLCGIPGVSSAIAIKIAERYPTMRGLLDAYQTLPDDTSCETMLADIILTETDKQRRRIGNVISKRVYDYIKS